MFSRCMNPDCAAPFDFRRGRLFRFLRPVSEIRTHQNSHGVKHFWLCLTCSEEYVIEYQKGRVKLLRRNLKKMPAPHPQARDLQLA
jgi:hypothetical protein